MCPKGHYWDLDNFICNKCAINHYNDNDDFSTECRKCRTGYTRETGSTSRDCEMDPNQELAITVGSSSAAAICLICIAVCFAGRLQHTLQRAELELQAAKAKLVEAELMMQVKEQEHELWSSLKKCLAGLVLALAMVLVLVLLRRLLLLLCTIFVRPSYCPLIASSSATMHFRDNSDLS